MYNHHSVSFVTGSRYNGNWEPLVHHMEGYGVYVYPDNSEYCGEFRNGLFHGFGQLKLSAPYNFTYTGIFENGVLVEVEDMIFDIDNLQFRCDGISATSNKLHTSRWKYCTSNDRRYARELNWGLEPAGGPRTCFTNLQPMRSIRTGCYDTDEGIFNPRTGFVSEVPRPFPPQRFVQCASEVDWIKAKCRYGGSAYEHCDQSFGVPVHEACPPIGRCNLQEMQQLRDSCSGDCNVGGGSSSRRNHWIGLCNRLNKFQAEQRVSTGATSSSHSSGCNLSASSTSCPSFSVSSLLENLNALYSSEKEALEEGAVEEEANAWSELVSQTTASDKVLSSDLEKSSNAQNDIEVIKTEFHFCPSSTYLEEDVTDSIKKSTKVVRLSIQPESSDNCEEDAEDLAVSESFNDESDFIDLRE